MRLDVYLAETGLARSRTHADNLIKLGKVFVNGVPEGKPSRNVSDAETVTVDRADDYASLGGLKLVKAFDCFGISPAGKVCIDIGASNGGFTDVMLRGGARKVYCVDIGECALPEEMRSDERVAVRDRLNARYLSFEDIGIKADIVTVDVSFISLTYILPALVQFLDKDSVIIALVKPQFEVGRAELTKSGIVKSRRAALKAVENVKTFAGQLGLLSSDTAEAPHPFVNKNYEYLVAFRKKL